MGSRARAWQCLLAPASVAIVGDSPGPGRGGRIHRQLAAAGYPGAIYPVNPKYGEILGSTAYPDLASIAGPLDFVAVAVGAPYTPPIVEQCARRGDVGALLLISSGFADAGAEGRDLQERVRHSADEAGILLVGPNCYGIVNVRARFAAYSGALVRPLRPGPVALVFQSGALTHTATDAASARAPGYSYVITTGNEASLELADYVDVVLDDPGTRVVACYAESVKHPERFEAAARKARTLGKRLVVLKVGRSERGRRAALAHTGSLAGEDRLYDTWFAELGVVRVRDMDELIEASILLSYYPDLLPGTTAILSISGGGSAITADLAADVGLDLGEFGEETRNTLALALPGFATAHNPLDLTGAVVEHPEIFDAALMAVGRDPTVALVGLGLNSPRASDAEERGLYRRMAREALEVSAGMRAPFALFTLSSGTYDGAILRDARRTHRPALQGMRETLAVVAAVRKAQIGGVTSSPDAVVGRAPRPIAAALRAGAGPVLNGQAAFRVLHAAGVQVPRGLVAQSGNQAVRCADRIGYPVVLKIESPDIPHKTEVGGVRVGLADATAVRRAYEEIVADASAAAPAARLNGVQVQAMIRGGVEMLVGVTHQPGFPPLVVFGLGGVFVELLSDTAAALVPVSLERVATLLRGLRAAKLLDGHRGSARADVAALCHTVVAVSRLAWWFRDEIAELDINPLLVLPEGQGAVALDALIVKTGSA